MLSLQDSVFFEISIKSLLKSWSSSCEYLAKLAHMFTYHTWPPDLSTTHSQQNCAALYMRACNLIYALRFPIYSLYKKCGY